MMRQSALWLAVTGCASCLMFATAPAAVADECEESLIVADPYGLVWDDDVLVDLDTLIEVETLVDEYTERIDEAAEYEDYGLEPPDGVSSDDLIDEAQWEISDAIESGRSIAGCED